MGFLRGRGSPRHVVRWMRVASGSVPPRLPVGGRAITARGHPEVVSLAPQADQLRDALDPLPERRPGIGATPGLDPGPGRLRPQEIAESLPHARKRAGVAGRRAAHDVDEPLDVAPEPPERDAESVVIAGLDPVPGRLRPQEIAESLPHARKRAGVA